MLLRLPHISKPPQALREDIGRLRMSYLMAVNGLRPEDDAMMTFRSAMGALAASRLLWRRFQQLSAIMIATLHAAYFKFVCMLRFIFVYIYYYIDIVLYIASA